MTVVTPALPDNSRAPRDGLFRANFQGVGLRAAADDAPADETPVMTGHFAVFNEWTEINSMFEGHFLERFAPGAFKKTMKENRSGMRVLFQHGYDYVVGDKPLGPIDDLREDDIGAYYEVPLLDAGYVRNDILPGLQKNLYGASFRFGVMREEWVDEPGVSDDNPKGLPERTVKEARVVEFGPVTFPAYAAASAGIRSLSDDFLLARFARDPGRLQRLAEAVPGVTLPSVRSVTYGAEPSCTAPVRSGTAMYVRCGDCVECREAAIDPAESGDTTSSPGAGAEPHPGTTEPAEPRAEQDEATPDGAGAEPHPASGSRGKPTPLLGLTPGKETKPSWVL